MTDLRQDVTYALRVLRRNPGFAAIAVVTLALGIGGSTAMFTIVDSILLRPLSFAEPQRLTVIRPTSGSRVSPAYLHDWRLLTRAFDDMAGWHDVHANLTGVGMPLDVLADLATTNFFAVLGTPAFLGRTFTVGASLSDVSPEVILSHGFWQRRYGGDRNVIGRPITLDGERFTIVGVMPEGFKIRTNELAESRAELWIPLRLVPGALTGMGGILNVVARLAPGSTREEAQAELSLITRQMEAANPSYSRDWGVNVVPLHEATVRDVRLALMVLFGSVGILLLIACANVANLVLSRAAARRAELAIRLSLGATRGRLARQFVTETLVLTTAGGMLGVLVAVWGTTFVASLVPAGFDLPRAGEVSVNLSVLVFAAVMITFTAIFVGLVSSLHTGRTAPQLALQTAARGSSSAASGNRLGSTLIVSEVALAVILLAGAGLLVRSFRELSRVNPGFGTEQVLTMRTTLPAARYESEARIRAFGRELVERVANLPGIQAIGFANYLPMTRFGSAGIFEIEGRPASPAGDQPSSWISLVGGDYFEAMGIPLRRGRLFTDVDTEHTHPVFVIDEELARRYWAGTDPIGARITWLTATNEKVSGQIIGVVGSVRWGGMAANPTATTYAWFRQAPGPQLTIVARAAGDPLAMASPIAAQIAEIDPNQPVADIRTMRDLVSADLAQPRFTMLLLGSFAAAALLLAAIGLYGVIAFDVTERTQEIGVRIALGAERRDVLRLVMGRGMLLTGTGLTIGVVAALALSRTMASLVYGVSPADPVTLLAVAGFLTAVALLATYLPARRAARVDPMVAMRGV